MSSGFVLLHLLLWSFSTSISNAPGDPSSTALVTQSGSPTAVVASPDTGAEQPALPIGFPRNIIIEKELRATVVRLWASSPTFRAQCQKIGEHRLYRVVVVRDPTLSLYRDCRAQCVLRVYSSGFVVARVTVPSGKHLDELIPHELEHVVEHIEGVDVARNVRKYGAGAYDAGRGRIETVRAMRAGRQARAELAPETRTVALLTRR
jgi:hypothetical protein